MPPHNKRYRVLSLLRRQADISYYLCARQAGDAVAQHRRAVTIAERVTGLRQASTSRQAPRSASALAAETATGMQLNRLAADASNACERLWAQAADAKAEEQLARARRDRIGELASALGKRLRRGTFD